ncbi:MAG: hypothetical protein AB7D57_08050, partial [Desulfovibrionaceae bacterium]
MFNLIMISCDWDGDQGSISIDRVFEHTEAHIANQFRQKLAPAIDRLSKLPCLFMQEGTREETAHVGRINEAHILGGEIVFEYSFDTYAQPLKNNTVFSNQSLFGISNKFEFSRNHWAVKDVDLYRALYRIASPVRQRPLVFQIPTHEDIDPTMASAMMPFHAGFDKVYETIQLTAKHAGLECKRADDFWENDA